MEPAFTALLYKDVADAPLAAIKEYLIHGNVNGIDILDYGSMVRKSVLEELEEETLNKLKQVGTSEAATDRRRLSCKHVESN